MSLRELSESIEQILDDVSNSSSESLLTPGGLLLSSGVYLMVTNMRWKNNVLIALLIAAMLAQGFPVSAAEEGRKEDSNVDLPTPEEVSAVAQAKCGHWLKADWELYVEDLVWKSLYGDCAIRAILRADLLQRIGDHCQEADGKCIDRTLIETGVGPQYAALFEACVHVNEIGIQHCSYNSLVVPFGDDYVTTDCCFTPEDIIEDLCDNGVCLSNYFGVSHNYIDWPNGYKCPGNKVETEVTNGGGGWLLNLGVFVMWSVGSRSTVTTDVAWEVDCSIPITIHGEAWGGFFRQLRIERFAETKKICDYDGIIRWDCGDKPGEHWEEVTAAGREGSYDYDDDSGEQPPRSMSVSSLAGGKWLNEGTGSTRVITLFDVADDVVSGSTSYLVDYPDPDQSLDGLLDQVESIQSDGIESRH